MFFLAQVQIMVALFSEPVKPNMEERAHMGYKRQGPTDKTKKKNGC